MNQVLSISSVILGVYILALVLFKSPAPPQQEYSYHLGCFLVEHNITHSEQLSNAKKALNSKWKSSLTYRTNSLSDDYFEKQGLEIARSVDVFLNDYNRQKEQKLSYYQLRKATKKAYESYQKCTGQFDTRNFSQNSCQNIWFDYKNCSSILNLYKAELNELLTQKNEILQSIVSCFHQKKSETTKSQPLKNDYQRNYNIRDKQLESEQKKIQLTLKLIGDKIITTKYNLEVSQNETSNAMRLYRQCSENRKQFKKCEELSKQIRNLGHGTIQTLQQKLQRKRMSIFKIQNMLHEGSNSHLKQSLQEMERRSLAEYKKLHKIFAEIKVKMVKSCGCTERQEQKLLSTLKSHEKEEERIRRDLLEIEENSKVKHHQLHLVKVQRQRLYQEFQNKLKNAQKVETQNQVSPAQELKPLFIELNQIKEKIKNLQPKFYRLSSTCEASREELSKLLPTISLTSDCLNKRQYYLKLQDSLSKYKINENIELQSKERLIQAITNFSI